MLFGIVPFAAVGGWVCYSVFKLAKEVRSRNVYARAEERVIREYGLTVAERLSKDQMMTLARYDGPKAPDLVTPEDIERNRWAPQTEAEAREVVSGIVLGEQLRLALGDPHGARQFTYGDAGPPPTHADGRRVDYHLPQRAPLRLSKAYWAALKRNEAQIQAVMLSADGRASGRPAIAWQKPDHMTLTPDPHGSALQIGYDIRGEGLIDDAQQTALPLSALPTGEEPGAHCTCPPDNRPPVCKRRYALSECWADENGWLGCGGQ
jgi:hypothetical protein